MVAVYSTHALLPSVHTGPCAKMKPVGELACREPHTLKSGRRSVPVRTYLVCARVVCVRARVGKGLQGTAPPLLRGLHHH